MEGSFIHKRIWWLLIFLLFAAILASLLPVLPYQNEHKTTVEPLAFLGTYQLGEGAPPQPLTEDTSIDACKEKSITLRGTFDRPLQENTQIFFFMEYLEARIYYNGHEIYAWGTAETRPAFMRSAGAAWGHCIVPATLLPTDKITIVLKNSYANNYNTAYQDFLDSLQTGDSGALARGVLAQNWPQLLTGLLLFLLGIPLLLFALLLSRRGLPIHSSIYYCGFFIVSCGLWTVLNPIYSTLVLENAALVMVLETISLWLFPEFLFAYFGSFMQTRAKKANDLLVFCHGVALLIFLLLQPLGIADAYAVRDFQILLLACCVVGLMATLAYEYRHGTKSDLRTLMPVGALYIVFSFAEILNYQFEWFSRGAALTVGIFLFIALQFALAVGQIRNSLRLSMKASALEKDLMESRAAVMVSQIQPHFLYNALVAIKELCDTGQQQTTSLALEHFAYYLRGNLDSLSDKRLIPFAQEVKHVEDYLYLEKMRFEDRLHIVWELNAMDFELPALTLQPIVANAVRHGITEKRQGGTLTIGSQATNGSIIITVVDDGVGFDPTKPKRDGRTHMGIGNVKNRLAAQCGGQLCIESARGTGTTVQIILPATRRTDDENNRGG